jgi:hypothetical protein
MRKYNTAIVCGQKLVKKRLQISFAVFFYDVNYFFGLSNSDLVLMYLHKNSPFLGSKK